MAKLKGKRRQVREQKIAVVRQFLKTVFPGWSLYDTDDPATRSRFYTVHDDRGELRQRLRVSLEFLDEYGAREIPNTLALWDAPGVIKRVGTRSVLVTTQGLALS